MNIVFGVLNFHLVLNFLFLIFLLIPLEPDPIYEHTYVGIDIPTRKMKSRMPNMIKNHFHHLNSHSSCPAAFVTES